MYICLQLHIYRRKTEAKVSVPCVNNIPKLLSRKNTNFSSPKQISSVTHPAEQLHKKMFKTPHYYLYHFMLISLTLFWICDTHYTIFCILCLNVKHLIKKHSHCYNNSCTTTFMVSTIIDTQLMTIVCCNLLYLL